MPLIPKASDTPPSAPPEGAQWQREMREAFRSLEPLLRFLGLDPALAPERLLADPSFPLLTPKAFATRMAKGDWRDPLLLQILPLARESAPVPGFRDDAVGDLPSQIVPGLLHKYASRALMMVSHQCAVHCRYCFRREFPYGDLPRGRDRWEEAWAYLGSAAGVDEIVFSGGDPLFLDNRRLAGILEKAMGLPGIRTLRFHTRLPIVLPSRVEPGLLDLFREASEHKTLVIVVHANHPNEIDDACAAALGRLRSAGAMLLNQSVLLKGVNDDAGALADLSRKLMACGTLPYYLHQLDKVTGTAHFETEEAHGLALIESLRRELPGYAVPRYVRETAGVAYKTPLAG